MTGTAVDIQVSEAKRRKVVETLNGKGSAGDVGAAAKSVVSYTGEDCVVEDLRRLTTQEVNMGELRFADRVVSKVPIYNCPVLEGSLETSRIELLQEWETILESGPGVLVLEAAFGADVQPIDAATKVFNGIIAEQRLHGGGTDHFANAGANDRIWNAVEKLCVQTPEVFARYFGNPFLTAVSEAWLGPGFQMTSQVNLIRPGGEAQAPHRDYHLGFQSAETVQRYPKAVHRHLSPRLTLQGAVAHVDVPVKSGPTKLLPFSQLYEPGYFAWRRPEFQNFFEEHCVQLPLRKGDCVFFNPALFHAGGANRTSGEGAVQRMMNLLQVSSSYGRAMDAVNRTKMCKILFPVLRELQEEGKPSDRRGQNPGSDTQTRLHPRAVECAVACCAEGYAFPTNLDLDPPVGGLGFGCPKLTVKRFCSHASDHQFFGTAGSFRGVAGIS